MEDEPMITNNEPVMEVMEDFRASFPLTITRDNVSAYFVGIKLGIQAAYAYLDTADPFEMVQVVCSQDGSSIHIQSTIKAS